MSKLQDNIQKMLSGTYSLKHPTLAADFSAYASGANKTFEATYNDYLKTVETIDRAIRIHANIFSLMKLRIFKEDNKNALSDLKVKNLLKL